MRKRLTRIVAVTAMLGSAVTLAGGSLAATASRASAAAGGANVCASSTFVGTLDLVTGVFTATGTLSDCHEHGSGTTVEVIGPNQDPTAPSLVTIHWATGHAASEAIVTAVPRSSVDPMCPVGYRDFTTDVYSTIVHGPYTGSTSHGVQCDDFSGFPTLRAVGIGPGEISR
jgi:hypothetical protein